ncbi:MAG: ABC transporter ATP-binding protein [Rhodospirillales bacterium]|nr:ABC transporter ATP-binding protein [Rhodospirillales bacterium]
MAQSKLKIRDLRKTYGPVVALAGAGLDLSEGEFLTLLGPSGSGKTTMLMMIAGLTQPDSGEVWIDGKLATYAPAHRRDIGMVFQNYALFPHLTVFENIAFPLRMRRLPEADIAREVGRVLDVVRLPGVGDRLPRALSGGQQQRIALARCIVYRPSIVLMDEPLGALDKKLRDQMELEIKRLHQELGITVLYVTHDQEEAMIMSDRICLMNDARIEQIGSPADLYFRPLTVFAADFLGESNLFNALVEGETGAEIALRGPAGALIRVARDPERPAARGRPVKVMVRPEMLTLLADGALADNVLDARLTQVILVGGVTKYYARLADGTLVSATALTRGPVAGVTPDSPIRLGWSKASGVILAGAERPR